MTNGIGRVGWRNYVSVAPTTSSIITTGLVLNLDASNPLSYSGTGTTWTDLSGNGNNGTLTNGTSYSSANGGTLTFDGINDYVDTDLLTNQSAFTYGVWAKSSANGFNNRIMGCGDSTGGSSGVDIIWGALGSNTIYSVRRGAGVLDIHAGYDTPLPITNFSGNWHYIVVTYDSVNGSKLYCDNVLVASKANIGFASSLKLRIGKDGNGYDAFNGSVGAVQVYNKALSSTEITQNFDATKSRFGFTSYTTRTAAFAIATGITDTTILNALNTFDTGLISNGLATKMKALYPFVGGTSTTHKFNFMDARDVNAAYRLQFSGGMTHGSNGVLFNGMNGWADTYLIPSTSLSLNSSHASIYSRTDNTVEAFDFYTPTYYTFLLGMNFGGLSYNRVNQSSYSNIAATDSLGLRIINRTSSTTEKLYKNSSLILTTARNSTSLAITPIAIAKTEGSGVGWSNRQYSFMSIGDGLTDGEASALYTLTQALQTALSRQV
jgi:hypothetical protein